MEKIRVFISGEDEVTREVVRRLLAFCSSRFEVISEIPARGGEVKKMIPQMNELAKNIPVILLIDLDATCCAPILKKTLLQNSHQSKYFLLNIAVDETEAWLMADRENFASFLGVSIDDIPQSALNKQGGRHPLVEMNFSYKSSMVLTHEIAPKSDKNEIKVQISAKGTSSKGPEYNTAIIPYIKNVWDVENAMQNSDSLQRIVRRIKYLGTQF